VCLVAGCASGAGHDPDTPKAIRAQSVSELRTARCAENQSGPLRHQPDQTLRWTAQYRFSVGSGDQPQIHIVSVGSDPGAATDAASPWTLSWVAADGSVTRVGSSAKRLPSIRVNAANANLLSPDHDCSLVLSAASYLKPIAVIGDSVFAGIESRLATTGLPHASFARSWLITAEAGFGWGASAPSWPLSTIQGSWAIGLARGLASIDPACLIVELGANDALRATFADALGKPELAAQIRRAVEANIDQLLTLTAQLGIPVVLVTAPTDPTTSFGGGVAYANEARLVNTSIRTSAQAASGRVTVADWAAYSAPHHGVAALATKWFIGDDLHPSEAGDEALVNLVMRSAQQIIQSG
jgi:lysophospholipase L1-like esterase